MYKIATLNPISERGLKCLRTVNFTISDNLDNPDGIIVRSFNMSEESLNPELLAVARAGAGTNNIPVDKCSEKGIVVFNTPGANANAVKELVVAGMLLSTRRIISGVNWVKSVKGDKNIAKLVEKEKSRFVGPELSGKKICVVGLGAIGVMVANITNSLGMEVFGYDPFMTVESAWGLSRSVHRATELNSILPECDFVTLHMPLSDATRGMVNEKFLSAMKKGSRLLNFSRAELVDSGSLETALTEGRLAVYVTDFPTPEVVELPNVISTPHLGASTPEAEENCAEMAARQLKDYLETGSIVNSVNFPNIQLSPCEKKRIIVLHSNVPHMIGQIASIISKYQINIDNMVNKNRGAYACTIFDVDELTSEEEVINGIKAINSVTRVRIL